MTSRRVVLVVVDGWGCNDSPAGNAIAAASTPVVDRLTREWPATRVAASGAAVGLPDLQQGNSEVGHLTIGAGRVIFQDLPRITRDIVSGAFFENVELVGAVDRVAAAGTTLHVVGLVSPGGVHSHQDHALAIAALCRRRGLDRVVFHAITDGRDEPPASAADFVAEFESGLRAAGGGRIGSVSGRYWAMDRDQRWERTKRAYRMLVGEAGEEVPSAVDHIRAGYVRGVTDEFLEPVAIVPPGEQRAAVGDGDGVVVFNFRPDRARQLCHALVDENFVHFSRRRLRDLRLTTFAEYEAGLTAHVAFPKQRVANTLAEVVSGRGLAQFHVAETEKYAHVTYFLNGGREEPFPGEERVLVPSPRVATYDLTPAMSAVAVTDAVVARVEHADDALVVVNYANPDMVGHTGEFAPTVEAVECVDACLGRVADAALAAGAALVVTADHGNAELKVASDGSRLTAHTTSPVPLFVVGGEPRPLADGGGLADVAPTVLGLLGLGVPADMTGRDLRR